MASLGYGLPFHESVDSKDMMNIELLHSGGQVAVVRRHRLPHRLLCLFANVVPCRFGVSEVGSDTAVQSDNKIQQSYCIAVRNKSPFVVGGIRPNGALSSTELDMTMSMEKCHWITC
jgi:hypothetical protein